MRSARFYAVSVTILLAVIAAPAHSGDRQPKVQLIDGEILVPPPPFTLYEYPEIDKPCSAGEDNRNSDLCAQWKAADAAESSADYAGLSVIVGFMTLLAAGGAAYYARQAAYETKRSADAAHASVQETRRIGRDQLRAYVFVDHHAFTRTSNGFVVRFVWKNSGQTPARNCRTSVSWAVYPASFDFGSLKYSDIRLKEKDGVDSSASSRTSIPPGGTMISMSHEVPNTVLNDLVARRQLALAHGFILYSDAFGKRRYARFCQLLQPVTGARGEIDFRLATLPIGNTYF